MFYVYVLLGNDSKFYTGYTENLRKRLEQHNKGNVKSTKHRIPLKLIYYEACVNRPDALKREK